MADHKVLSKKLDAILLKMKDTCTKADLKQEIQSVKDDLQGMRSKITELEKFVEYNSPIIDRVPQIEKDLFNQGTLVRNIDERMKFTRDLADNIENQGRKHMLELSGIPVSKEEQNDRYWCKKLAIKLHKLITNDDEKEEEVQNEILQVEEESIKQENKVVLDHGVDVAHRIKGDRIIVTFISRTHRDLYYGQRYKLKDKSIKDLGLELISSNTKGLIWINESLTGRRKFLMSKVKETMIENGFLIGKDGIKVYSSLGQVKIVYNDTVYKINCPTDIDNLIISLGGRKR